MKLRPAYQKIIDAASVLPDHEWLNIRSKVELYAEYADIRDAYFNRGEVTAQQKIQELATEYHYSHSSIEKIIWCK